MNNPSTGFDYDKCKERFSTSYLDAKYRPLKLFYMDLSCLRDLRLGALLSMLIAPKVEYQYIRQHILNYQFATDDAVAKYFPDLGFTDAQIEARLRDPQWTAEICKLAPMTNLYTELDPFFHGVQVRNKPSDYRGPLRLLINTYPINYPEFWQRHFRAYLQSILTGIDVRFVNYDWPAFTPAELRAVDYFLIHDFVRLFSEGSPFAKAISEEGILENANVCALLRSDIPDLAQLDYASFKQAIAKTEALMSWHCAEFRLTMRQVLLK
jgi:hypothetical protein